MPLGFVDLPLWQCVVLAFLPPTVIAVIGWFLSKRITQANDNVMTSISRIAGAALVFICAFMVATLWQQTTTFLDGWRSEYRAATELQRTADILSATQANDVHRSVAAYMRAVHDTEVEPPNDWATIWQGSQEATLALIETAAVTEKTAASLPPDQAKELRTGMQVLEDARVHRFERGIQPGSPAVIILVVLLLAWSTILILSLYPGSQQRGVKMFQTVMSVVIVGLVQVPVYYLIGTGAVQEFVAGLYTG